MTHVTAAFDRAAPGYAAQGRADRSLALIKRRVLRRLTAGLAPGARILDAGCGVGQESAALAARGYRVTALDAAAGMAVAARRRLAPWVRRGLVRVVRVPFDLVPDPGTYDAVLCLRSANFSRTLGPVARLCTRALRPGGRAAVTTAGRWAWQDIARGLAAGDWSRAFRRLSPHGVPLASPPVRAWAPPLGAALAAFRARGLVIARVEPLGLLLPAPGGGRPGRRLSPAVRRWLDRAESGLTARPLVRLADHALVIVNKP